MNHFPMAKGGFPLPGKKLIRKGHPNKRRAICALLQRFSTEITALDNGSRTTAIERMDKGREVFIASLPKQTTQQLVETATELRDNGLVPVPHLVARNINDRFTLDRMLRELREKANVDRVLILGGDREAPIGEFDNALQLLRTGLLQKHGIGKIYLACYPESHPRIPEDRLWCALEDKVAAAEQAGLDVTFVSQFCFQAEPIQSMVEKLRALGFDQPIRIGMAGPTSYKTLAKYAMICGVGASFKSLKKRSRLSRSLLTQVSPDKLLEALAESLRRNSDPGIEGVHFFTFGALDKTLDWLHHYQ